MPHQQLLATLATPSVTARPHKLVVLVHVLHVVLLQLVAAPSLLLCQILTVGPAWLLKTAVRKTQRTRAHVCDLVWVEKGKVKAEKQKRTGPGMKEPECMQR